MSERFFVTTYDRAELVSMIRDAFRDELKEYLDHLKTVKEDNVLLSRQEVAQLLKISLPTLQNYQKAGILKGYRIGSRILFKKGEVIEALQLPIKYRRWNDPQYLR